jgi:hypothetical protein
MISEDGYYVIVIIITIIGFILLISFAFYYLYIPFIRINSILQDTIDRGNDIISKGIAIEDQIRLTNQQIQAIFVGFCNLNNNKNTDVVTFSLLGGSITYTVEKLVGPTFDDFCQDLSLQIPT